MNSKTKKLIYNIVAFTILFIVLLYISNKFIHLGNVEYTNNAQVKQLVVPVNTRIQGFIKKVYFEEYSHVKKGDTLAIIEDSEYRYLFAQAEANLVNAQTGKEVMNNTISTTSKNISVSDASIEEMYIQLENAKRNYNRFKALYEKGAVTRQQYDDVETNYSATKVRYEKMIKQKESVELVSREQKSRLGQNEANIKVAEAALELARLNLSYTTILAPCDGITGRKSIQAGQLLQPGQTIVDIVSNDDKWIIANYKESQIANIRQGQEVEIEIDAIPDIQFKGTVRSISGATGACFSLMPQDNSSGNFIKIEQRIPVRIDFSEDNDTKSIMRVGAGMNVECKVLY